MHLREIAEPYLCECLLQAKRNGRVGHAYLFVGDNVPFLLEAVRAWIQVCACTAPREDGDACGICAVCQAIAADTYADLHTLKPQSKSRQILVGQMRDFEHQLNLVADKGHLKVGLIIEADCMGEEAQNAFLKTLEEPPPRTLLVLLTVQPRGLLPTIRSRCQIVSLRRNRREYTAQAADGLFEVLASLRPRAGAVVGLAAAARLKKIFAGLQQRAEQTIDEHRDERWDEIASGDAALLRLLKAEEEARIQAEYVRLRQEYCDAIQTWIRQEILVAAGLSRDRLPHPELLPDETGNPPPTDTLSPHQALGNVTHADELMACLEANVPEHLALETFCLALTEKRR